MTTTPKDIRMINAQQSQMMESHQMQQQPSMEQSKPLQPQSSQQQQRIRYITADTVRQLWTTINGLKQAKTPPNIANICQKALKTYGWKSEETTQKLMDCCDYSLLVRKYDPQTNQELIFTPDSNALEQEHDRFCFECHDAGTTSPCTSCFRVYHPACKSGDGTQFLCNACQLFQSPRALDRDSLTKQLEGMLAYANTRGGPNFNAMPNAHSPNAVEHHRLLIARPIDLTVMRGRVAKGEYVSAGQFLADFKLLVHNITILYGKESNLTNLARELLKQIKAEVEIMESGQDDEDSMNTPSKFGGKGTKRKQDAAADGDREMPAANKRGRKKAGETSGVESASATPTNRSPQKHSTVSVQTDQPKIVISAPGGGSTNCNCDAKYRQMVSETQQNWLTEYKQEREKCLTELAERLHKEFLSDQDKLRSDMLNQFKQDLEQTKKDLDVRYSQQLKQEIQKQMEKHKRMLTETKKKQWCFQCEAEAIYHCCWNTAYCSIECQQQHWPLHRRTCKRKKQQA